MCKKLSIRSYRKGKIMNKRAGNSAIIHIAKREGKNVNEIREEINKAIEIAYASRKEHPAWGELFGDRKPTAEEFIETMAMRIVN